MKALINIQKEKESVVVTTLKAVKPLFSVANLWQIQKSYVTSYNRRRSLAL